MNFQLKKFAQKTYAFALGLLATTAMVSCDGYDLAEREPEWLGSSIYDYLNEGGNFTNMVRLIDDLNYKEVLSRTGSKTLFVADDEAFQRFYKQNDWGVKSYDELTEAQKKLLLYGSMINNSCQVAYLSSSEGPTEGDCMRRLTSGSIYDSVPILKPQDMPQNSNWDYYRAKNKSIPCFEDMSTAPMIHFIEAFLNNRLITNDDCDFLFNYQSKRQPGDANVNGIMMVEQNIKCSNGFVHRMQDVLTPMPNMAEFINSHPTTSEFARLLERYSAPYYAGDEATREYNRLTGANVDSVFQKRYFSERSQGGMPLDLTPAEGPVNGKLKFDPGWNEFYSQGSANVSSDVALQRNMGVMLVPSNDALNYYWNEGAGKVLKDNYGTWENVPDNVISKMLNVSMLNSFVNSVPSKFNTILNDANDEMGVRKEDIDSVYMTCNGAIYITNKVFNPVAYISVSFPALVNETMQVLNWAIEQLGYDVYLNSQNSYYSLFIPTNEALLEYIDPCSFGKNQTQMLRFHYDAKAQDEKERVYASIWNYDTETGMLGDSIGLATRTQVLNRLEDVLNTHIVIGNVEDGHEFYQTKGGSVLQVKDAAAGEGGMMVAGGGQLEKGKLIPVAQIYDESREGNGKTYVLADEPLLTSRNSVADILASNPDFSEFYNLLQSSPYLETKHVIGTDEHGCASTNISLFNTFRYTVLVPTNESIRQLIKDGKLPTWDDVEKAETDEEKKELREEIELFLKYHIVDNSFFVGQAVDNGSYETSAYTVDSNKNTSYYKVSISADGADGLKVKDLAGNVRKVQTTDKAKYNLMAREYQFDNSDATKAQNIYTSSYAVVHQIDGVLDYKKPMEVKRDIVEK